MRVIICGTVCLGRGTAPQLVGCIELGNGSSKAMAKPFGTPDILHPFPVGGSVLGGQRCQFITH